MPEKLTVYSLDGKPRVLTQTKRVAMPIGVEEEQKFLVTTNSGLYIQRPYHPHVIVNLHAMEQARLPVPKGVLINPETGLMLVPDLKADGSELYGKSLMASLLSPQIIRYRPRPAIDEIYVDLTSSDKLPRVKRSLDTLIARANEHDIELPHDDPLELRVRPSGKAQFICVDLDLAKTEAVSSESERRLTRESNEESREFVFENLEFIRELLLNS
jgi:hypothetical protein